MTAKLYESIKLRLDQLADKGIENIDDMTPEDKKEFDYIVNILTRISDVDVSDVLGYLTISRLRKFMLMQKWPIRSVAVLNWKPNKTNGRLEK
jgi:hypothetical protein